MGSAVAFASLGVANAWAASADGVSDTAESIHQEPVFKVGRRKLYETLLDAKRFHQVTLLSEAIRSGMVSAAAKPTEISGEPGGAFQMFGGHITGRHIELVPGQRIVQAWRAESWKPGSYSIVRFELLEDGVGTKILFDHTGFPQGQGHHLAEGWASNYWQPLKTFLE